MKRQGQKGKHEYAKEPGNCPHVNLLKVEASGINDVDTEVLLYACSTCGKTFTITAD